MAKKIQQTEIQKVPLVAIDLGSSSVKVMAAQSIDNNHLHILGVEENTKYASIEHGDVKQCSNVGFMINESLRLLANRIGVKELPTCFTLLGGQTIIVSPVQSSRDLIQKRVIPKSMFQGMEEECIQKIEEKYQDFAVLGLVPSYTKVDDREIEGYPEEPTLGAWVTAHYTAFIGSKEHKKNLYNSFARSATPIESAFIRSDAILSAFNQNEEHNIEDGCAIIDFGAQTTTLSIYKKGQYLDTAVVAQGGKNISRNIEQHGIDAATAEKLKCYYGVASPELIKQNQRFRMRGLDGNEIQLTSEELAQTIQMKLDEILDSIIKTLKKYEERIQVVYVTGGGAKLEGLIEYLQEKIKVEVCGGYHGDLLLRSDPDEYCDPKYSALVGALIMGADYREKHKNENLYEKKKGFFQTIIDNDKINKRIGKVLTIFDEKDE